MDILESESTELDFISDERICKATLQESRYKKKARVAILTIYHSFCWPQMVHILPTCKDSHSCPKNEYPIQ